MFEINPGRLLLENIQALLKSKAKISLLKTAYAKIDESCKVVSQVVSEHKTVYGINTGFGLLANQSIGAEDLSQLQTNLILSHATGVGKPLGDKIVQLILLLKINSLARGYSGVRHELIDALITLYNHEIYPIIPEKGSVGASGDLAPLAHLSCILLGVGFAHHQGKKISAQAALKIAGLKPIELDPKEGLALINGTQASTAIALFHLIETKKIFEQALIAGALTIDAAAASLAPFDERIHKVRGHETQMHVAKRIRELLQGSEILNAHQNCDKVQDPYSLRCQPQVMGACLQQIHHVEMILETEANAVSDNPLVFSDNGDIISGGNFHAEPVAFAADNLALAIAEIGALSERRISLLIDKNLSGLPAFLIENAGLNSGFMIAHVTASALASENKSLAHPASVDSLPTSANQEDHVSMATFAARRLGEMIENTRTVIAIEMLAASQGLDLRAPLKTSSELSEVHQLIREHIPNYKEDRYFYDDIQTMLKILKEIEKTSETA